MKKILLSTLLISSISFGADAVTYAYDVDANYEGTYALSSAANYNGKKFYVNPGHGGFDSNDRPTAMPLLGSEKFYESEGNLDRGKHLKLFLTKNGGSVKMSRTKNTTSDDLGLSTIAANSNTYGGYFISLHSNGANASANYVVTFYRGVQDKNSSAEVITGSKAMAQQVSNWHDEGRLTNVTYSTPRALSDYAFNGWNYGVLRTNSRPGYLVETWFHDYRPESLRMKSSVYNKFLAWQIARATLTKPGGSGSLPACIIGDIRDKAKSCGYTNYTTRGDDAYLAVEGAKVTLVNSSGSTVATHTTDKKGNGVYAFFVPAGTYTIKVTKDGYKDASAEVTVTNNNIKKKTFRLTAGVNEGISVASGAVNCGEITKGETVTKTVKVEGTGLSSNITVTSSNNTHFTVTPTSLGTTGGTLTIKYNPTVAGSHSTTITLKSGSYDATITAKGTAKNPPLTFTEVWNYSENSGNKAAWMADFANYRNMAFGDGKLYIVDHVNTVIKVIKAQTGEHIKDLNMTGVSGGAKALCDVAFVDGKIVATNIAAGTSNTLKVYVWDNDDAAPRVLLETTDLGGMNRVGDGIEVKGDLNDGQLVYLGQQSREVTNVDKDGNTTTETKNCNSLVTYALKGGVASTSPVVADIDAFVLGTSPRAVPTGDNYWVMGINYFPSQINDNGELLSSVSSSVFNIVSTGHGAGNDLAEFTFNGTNYAFVTDYASVDVDGNGTCTADEIKNQNFKKGCAVLIEGTNGWNAEGLTGSGRYPAAGMGSTKNTNASSSICTAVNGSEGVEMWVLINYQGIAYYKHGTAPTYTYEPVPEITVSGSFNFSAIEGNSVSQTIAVVGELLTENISVALSGSSAFSIDKTSLGSTGGNIKVTYKPTAAGEHTATLTLTSAGAATKTITLNGKADAAIAQGLTKVWQNTTNVPGVAASGDVRFAGVSNGKFLAADKAGLKLVELTETGYSDYYDCTSALTTHWSVKTMGPAIGCDDAGNILIHCGWSGATSGSNFTLISADLKSTYKIDLSTVSGYTATRIDQIGRIRGNMLSSEGAYVFFAPNTGTTVLIVKIVNGAIDADYTQASAVTSLTNSTSTICQPAFATVAEIDALMDENGDLSNSFILRTRTTPGSVFGWNADNSAMEATWKFTASTSGYKTANASVEGFDWFKLYDKSYFIMPLTTDGTVATRGSVFGIFDEDGNCVAEWSEGEKTGLGACFGSFIVVPNNDYSVFIYHFVPGTVAEKFTFAVEPQASGVEEIEESVIEENIDAPVEYYNLQGVRVENPAKGIYIKRQGNKVSKIYVR